MIPNWRECPGDHRLLGSDEDTVVLVRASYHQTGLGLVALPDEEIMEEVCGVCCELRRQRMATDVLLRVWALLEESPSNIPIPLADRVRVAFQLLESTCHELVIDGGQVPEEVYVTDEEAASKRERRS
jgi:hypothetical protein